MRQRTYRLVALCATIATLFLAACGGGSSSEGKATVTFITWEGTATNSAIDAAMKKFGDANITINRLESPNSDYGQKINSLTLAKRLPDFFWCGNDTELDLGSKGVLYDWSKYVNKTSASFDKSKFAPGALDAWVKDGHLYGLPTLLNVSGLFYNIDEFTKANVPLPKAGWTYTDYLAAAKALTVKGSDGKVTRYGSFGGPYYDPFFASVYGVSAGGQPFVDSITKPSVVTADDKYKEGVQKIADAVKSGYLAPPDLDIGDTNAAFLAGKLPMLWGGQWLAASFLQSNPTIKFGFVPQPIVNDRVQIYDAVGICSPTYIQNPDAVWKVMTFLDTQAWNDILPSAPVAPAAYSTASAAYYDTLNSKNYTSLVDGVKWSLDTPKKIAVRFNASWSDKAWDIIDAHWTDILNGKKPISDLDKMVAELTALIKSS